MANRVKDAGRAAKQNGRADFTEIGQTGLRRSAGHVFEEFLPQLQGRQAVRVYEEMSSNDPVVGASLFAIEMLIRQVEWSVEPGEAGSAAEEIAAFVDSCFGDMSVSWPDTLAEILSFLPFGWSWHETVYKRREGESRDPTRRSRYTDGRIGWRKLPIRAQTSLDGWRFGDDGGVEVMEQRAAPDYHLRVIPIEKSLLFRTKPARGSPQGRSILRTAYRSWYFKKRIEEIEGIGIERDLAGLPVADVPAEWLSPSATPSQRAALEALREIVRDVKRDEQEGIILPAAYDEQGNRIADLRLLSTGSRRAFDTNAIINRWDQRIAMSVLADFVFLGHETHGSFALASSKTNLFTAALGAVLSHIAGVFNRHAIPRLLALNGMPVEDPPQLTYGDIEAVDMGELGTLIELLARAGMPLFPDDETEAWIRDRVGMPQPARGL